MENTQKKSQLEKIRADIAKILVKIIAFPADEVSQELRDNAVLLQDRMSKKQELDASEITQMHNLFINNIDHTNLLSQLITLLREWVELLSVEILMVSEEKIEPSIGTVAWLRNLFICGKQRPFDSAKMVNVEKNSIPDVSLIMPDNLSTEDKVTLKCSVSALSHPSQKLFTQGDDHKTESEASSVDESVDGERSVDLKQVDKERLKKFEEEEALIRQGIAEMESPIYKKDKSREASLLGSTFKMMRR